MEIKRKKVDVLTYRDFANGASFEWEDVYLPTRTNVTQRLLLAKATNMGDKAVVLFKGAEGTPITCKKEEGLKLNNNFLVRSSALFAEAGFMTAIVDAPSDKGYGMENRFRKSEAHQKDIAKVVDFLVEEGAREVFLVGTSRGTLSAAYLATVMTHANVQGYVLTASLDSIKPYAESIEHPVYMLHNSDDGCSVTTYNGALDTFYGVLEKKNPRNYFRDLSDGDPPIDTNPCQARTAHGFLGLERDAVAGIVDWMNGGTPPEHVGP